MRCSTCTSFNSVRCSFRTIDGKHLCQAISMKYTMCFLGCLQYLLSLAPGDTDETVYGEAVPNSPHRYRYKKSAFPQPLPTLPMSKEAAFHYMRDCMRIELRMRVCDARVDTFLSRLDALAALTKFLRANPVCGRVDASSRCHAPGYDLVSQAGRIFGYGCRPHQHS